MKKLLTVLFISLILLSGCSSKKVEHEKEVAEIIEKFENNDSFVLYLGSPDCPACLTFNETYDEIYKEYPELFFSLNYTDAKTNHSIEYAKLEELYLSKLLFTPTVYFIKDGSVVYSETGVLKYSAMENSLSVYGILE